MVALISRTGSLYMCTVRENNCLDLLVPTLDVSSGNMYLWTGLFRMRMRTKTSNCFLSSFYTIKQPLSLTIFFPRIRKSFSQEEFIISNYKSFSSALRTNVEVEVVVVELQYFKSFIFLWKVRMTYSS